MTRIKICGITNLRDALLAADFGADAIGFIFAPSTRRILPAQARKIISKLPPFVHKVGVFRNEELNRVKEIMGDCMLDFAQFHGEEDRSYVRSFGKRAIKVFEITRHDVLKEVKKFSLPYFMLDLPKESGPRGSLDWELVKEAKKWGKLILAGGLTPENIETVLRNTSPYCVDVCRAVEERRGKKNPERLEEFILKVRRWDILRA